ncbi:MAG TPA: transglutaminase-like cysteine peptidase [Albidovulum sp.]|nr:transglutaminase-like cysteine peptidase [Albidovulum sp.]
MLRIFGFAAAIALAPASTTFAGQPQDFLVALQPIDAPAGAGAICTRYDWACARGAGLKMSDRDAIKIARVVNAAVNRGIRPISDRMQYGVEENWTLPSSRGGDCEDLVLMKKKALIAKGMAPERLMIATVLDRKQGSHAVLVLRTAAGDYVLDSLVGAIKPWSATGYSFLRMQDPAAPSRWNAIFAGGIFGHRA